MICREKTQPISIGLAANKLIAQLRLVANIQHEEKPPDPDVMRKIYERMEGRKTDWSRWVLLLEDDDGIFWTELIIGKYWDSILSEISKCRSIYVFRGDGLFYRSYRRIYTYPKIVPVKLEEIPVFALKEVMPHTTLGYVRQYRDDAK